MNDITPDELQSLIDDILSTITEAKFTARWVLVEGYHKIGERLQGVRNDKKIIVTVTQNTGIKERTLYRAIQFYKKFPDLNLLPEGKNVSWHDICNKYLPVPKDEPEPELCTCPTCGQSHRSAHG